MKITTLTAIAVLGFSTIALAATLGPHKVIQTVIATVEKEDIEHLYPISDKTGKRVKIDWTLTGEGVVLQPGKPVVVVVAYDSEFLDQIRVEGYPKLLLVPDEELDK